MLLFLGYLRSHELRVFVQIYYYWRYWGREVLFAPSVHRQTISASSWFNHRRRVWRSYDQYRRETGMARFTIHFPFSSFCKVSLFPFISYPFPFEFSSFPILSHLSFLPFLSFPISYFQHFISFFLPIFIISYSFLSHFPHFISFPLPIFMFRFRSNYKFGIRRVKKVSDQSPGAIIVGRLALCSFTISPDAIHLITWRLGSVCDITFIFCSIFRSHFLITHSSLLDDARQHSSSNMVIMLIGNKSDLERYVKPIENTERDIYRSL